jgi:NAD+ kinase
MVVKPDDPEAAAIARTLCRWLRRRGKKTLAEPGIAGCVGGELVSREELARRSDLILVLGGDGTLLGIARMIGAREIPIVGINLGGLGFLTEIGVSEAKSVLGRVIEGHYNVDRRITLEAQIRSANGARDGRRREPLRALNDVVLSRGPLGRMVLLEVLAQGEPFCTYRCDGLIVATPTGSTAYALSTGGPIVFPTVNALVLAPICPHTLSNRPVVLPDSVEIEIRVRAADHDAILTVDGQESARLGPTDIVSIRRGRHHVALVRSAHPYFEIWRDKLHWG